MKKTPKPPRPLETKIQQKARTKKLRGMASGLRMRRQQQLRRAISSLLGPDSIIEPSWEGLTCDQRPRRVSSVEYREQDIW